ncbi:PQQ-binding-like beta-propeller repeat protein [Prosthecobacter sp. SYSU 5D2]|uniref:PQQ-binding-like beta-propeller repeat protein n=1 Tax=Prosthecobacter sp. SYSU 5D2 TaxID=3134134 RepID=UPI0031FEAA21
MRLVSTLTLLSLSTALADWPQWRGPARDGVSTDTTPIAESFPEEGLTKVWESDFIPSDHLGGHGSPVVAGEQAFISVVWHDKVPSEQREIDSEVMQQMNYRGTSPELAKKMEADRLSMPAMRGAKLDEWLAAWRKENLSKKEDLSLGKWAESRFKAGKSALPLEELARVSKRQNKPFANLDAFKQWMEDENFSQPVKDKLMVAVPNTIKVAKDVVVCLDVNTGKEVWKFEAEGKPTGRSSSSTAAVVDEKVYAAGSTHLYCLNQKDGKMLWKAPLPSGGPAASPLVVGDTVYMAAGRAQAFSTADGKILWEQKDASGNTGSPVLWTPESGDPVLLVVGSKTLYGLSPKDGKVLWNVEGGGQSTPVTQGDWLVIYSGAKDVGLRAYQHVKDAAPKAAWSHFWETVRYSGSPIIHDDHVYLTCGGKHQCVELATGKVTWLENEVNSTITSPIIADGKLIVYENNGSHLRMVKAQPGAYQQLARAKVEGMGCTSPALSNGRLIVRQREKLVCYDLRPKD